MGGAEHGGVVHLLVDEKDPRREGLRATTTVLEEDPAGMVLAVTAGQATELRDRGFRLLRPPHLAERDRPEGETAPLVRNPNPGCVPTTQVDEIEKVYREYLHGNPVVAAAVDLAALPATVIGRLWPHLRDLEDCGYTYVADPVRHPVGVGLTPDERDDIRAARLAHSLWVDHRGLVPWRLHDYSADLLEMLFSPTYAFWQGGDGAGGVGDYTPGIIDPSPSDAYTIAGPLIGATAADTVRNIVAACRFPRFIHGVRVRHPIEQYDTLAEMWARGVSLQGCQSSVGLLIGLGRAVNIPGDFSQGWFEGMSHASAVWPDIGVLLHGDDIYDPYLGAVPIEDLLAPYPYFRYAVQADGPYTETARFWTLRRNTWLAALHPSPWLIRRFCDPDPALYATGLDYLRHEFAAYLPDEAIGDITERITALGGCP